MEHTASRKKTGLASSTIAVAVVSAALVAYLACLENAQAEYIYVLNEENWKITEVSSVITDSPADTIRIITIDAKGYAFERIDQETLKQLKAETYLTIMIGQKEDSTQKVNVTGSVKINEAVYAIQSGTVIVRTNRNFLYIRCEGVDEQGNKITLKSTSGGAEKHVHFEAKHYYRHLTSQFCYFRVALEE